MWVLVTSQAPLTRGHCRGKHAASSPIANLAISGLNSGEIQSHPLLMPLSGPLLLLYSFTKGYFSDALLYCYF